MRLLPSIRRSLVLLAAVLAALFAGGCGLLPRYEEPQSWGAVREHTALLSEGPHGGVTPLEDALRNAENELQATGALLLGHSQGATTGPLSQRAGLAQPAVDGLDAEHCAASASAWNGGAGQRVRAALVEQDRVAREYTGFENVVAFAPATVLYGGLREKFELLKPILGSGLGQVMDEAEQALSQYGERILRVDPSDGTGLAAFAVDDTFLRSGAHELTQVVQQHRSTVANLLTSQQRQGLDDLLALLSLEAERQEAEGQLREATESLLRTLDRLAASPTACQAEPRDALEEVFGPDGLSRHFQTLSNASKARHDVAMNAIRNMKA